MTERRDPQHGRPQTRSARDDAREPDGALADLQRQAGNKAVADLLGRAGTPVQRDPDSAGVRLRDALRAGRAPVQREFALGVQRDVLKEQLKAPGRLLRRGDQGEDVASVQRLLGVTADGIFGRKTRLAVVAFQGAAGLKKDGVVGPLTWGALTSVQSSANKDFKLEQKLGSTDKDVDSTLKETAPQSVDKMASDDKLASELKMGSEQKLPPESAGKLDELKS